MKVTHGRWLLRVVLAAAAVTGGVAQAAPKPAAGKASSTNNLVKVGNVGQAQQAPVTPVTPTTPDPSQGGVPAPATPGEAKPEDAAASGPMGYLAPVLEGLSGGLKLNRPEKFPVSMRVLVDTSVGTGGFVLNQYAKQPYLANTIRLQPSMAIWKSLRVSAVLNVTKEWLRSATQTTTVPNQIMLGDLWMGLGMPSIYSEPTTGLGFGAGVWAFAPTSIQSRSETMLLGVRPWVTLSWSKWGFDVAYTFSLRKNFHQYIHPTIDTRPGLLECAEATGRCFVGATEAGNAVRGDQGYGVPGVENDENFLRNVGGGRMLDLRRRNISHQVLHFLSGGYTFFDQLSLSGMVVLLSSFRYANPTNDFSSVNATNPWAHSDTLWTNIDLTWALFEHVAFSVGTSTIQPFFMMHRGSGLPGWNQNGQQQGEGKLWPSFPFFDLFTPGNNNSSFYFDVTFSI